VVWEGWSREASPYPDCLRGVQVPKDILVKTRAEAERYRHVPASLESEIFERDEVLYERR